MTNNSNVYILNSSSLILVSNVVHAYWYSMIARVWLYVKTPFKHSLALGEQCWEKEEKRRQWRCGSRSSGATSPYFIDVCFLHNARLLRGKLTPHLPPQWPVPFETWGPWRRPANSRILTTSTISSFLHFSWIHFSYSLFALCHLFSFFELNHCLGPLNHTSTTMAPHIYHYYVTSPKKANRACYAGRLNNVLCYYGYSSSSHEKRR